MTDMRIGVDLGGTKTEIIALAGAQVLARRRVPTPAGDYDATIRSVSALVRSVESETGRRGTVGMGIPGTLSLVTGLVKNANSTWLICRPLRQDLEAALDREVRIANDANCFALSEAVDGAGAGAHCVFGVILGTGVGGGVVVDGRVLTGVNAIAGEWGHNPLPWPDLPAERLPDCYCGRRGCVEAFLSGPALARQFAEAGGRNEQPDRIAAAAAAGDADARGIMERYCERLARALAVVVNVLDPDVVVLGGGLSNIDMLYRDVPPLWSRHVFSDEVRTRLVPNMHGDSGGVRGAAWLWEESRRAGSW